MSKGGSNPKGGVKRGKEQLESHTSPSLFSSKKRTNCNNNSPCASLTLMLFLRTSAVCYRQILSAGWWCWAGGGWTQQTVRRRRKTGRRKNSGRAVLELELQRKKKKKKVQSQATPEAHLQLRKRIRRRKKTHIFVFTLVKRKVKN